MDDGLDLLDGQGRILVECDIKSKEIKPLLIEQKNMFMSLKPSRLLQQQWQRLKLMVMLKMPMTVLCHRIGTLACI